MKLGGGAEIHYLSLQKDLSHNLSGSSHVCKHALSTYDMHIDKGREFCKTFTAETIFLILWFY